jgi:hypothetical protein
MDKESSGIFMEIYTLGDGRITTKLKERSASCKKMALTNSKMSSMIDEKRSREKK